MLHLSPTRVLLPTPIFAVMVVGLLVGCTEPRTTDADVQVIDVPDVVAALDKNAENVALVDVRPAKDYAAGHLPGAIRIPIAELRENDLRLRDKQIIVYGDGWHDPLPTAAVKSLIRMGYKNVYDFKGGAKVWSEAGRRLEAYTPAPTGRPESSR